MPCDNCPLKGQKQVVSRGPADAKVVVVGQSPGKEELQRGIPFIGPSGKILMKGLAEAGFDATDLLFTNAVRCSVKDKPTKKTIDCCHDYLMGLLAAHPRDLIIMLGNEAKYTLHGGGVSGVLEGQGRITEHDELDCQTFWNPHPAYILREPAVYGTWVQQFQRAKRLLDDGLAVLSPELEIISPIHLPPNYLTLQHWALKAEVLSVDIETTGFNHRRDAILGVGLYDGKQGLYIPFRHSPKEFPGMEWLGDIAPLSVWEPQDEDGIIEWLRAVFDRDVNLVVQGGKFDIKFILHQLGIDIRPIWTDTMLAHHLIDENAPHSLKSIAQTELLVAAWEDEAKEAMKDNRLFTLSLAELALYCVTDCMAAFQVVWPIRTALEEQGGTVLYDRLVGPLSDALVDMEMRGLLVDQDTLTELQEAVEEHITVLREEVRSHSGHSGKPCPWRKDKQDGINPRSGKDVAEVLYSVQHGFGLPVPKETAGGDPSTDKEVLLELLSKKPPARAAKFIKALLHHRRLANLNSTFIAGLWQYIDPDEGTVHSSFFFNPNTEKSPRTGRLSCSNPNLQNQPKEIRPVFVARPGYTFWDGDQGQLECRCWAHFSRDPNLVAVFERGVTDPSFDLHRVIAGICFGVKPEEVTSEQRDAAKVIMFGGVMYGGEEFIVAKELKTTPDAVVGLMQRLYAAFPQGQRWLADQIRIANQQGYVESTIGRRRRLPDIYSRDKDIRARAERRAKNSPVQGLASDINNLALFRLRQYIADNRIDAYSVNIVHDSILIEIAKDVVDEVGPVFKQISEQEPFPGFGVPLQVEVKVSPRWGGELDIEAICELGKVA